MTYSLKARVIYPVDRPPIEQGVVVIAAEKIIAVGGPDVAVGEIRDLGDAALLPGLVNAHTHLEFSHLQRPLGKPGIPLVDWIRLVIAERGHRDHSPPLAIEDGIHESLRCGVTSIGDITTGDVPAHYFPWFDLTLFAEVIGFSRARAVSALAALHGRLLMQQNPDSPAGKALSGVQVGISPHAPYTVSPDLFASLIELARNRSLPVAMHLAESEDELTLLRDGTGPFQELLDERSMWDAAAIPHGSRPLDYLRWLADVPRSLVIHGNYLDAEERDILAAHRDRMSLVYCPRTHAYFQHPTYPLADLLAAGVHIALGTDSRASNPDLDLLAEMRHVAQAHLAIDPEVVLRLGTLSGAEALGTAERVGSLMPGKTANLVAIPLPSGAAGSPRDLLTSLLAEDTPSRSIWLRGREILK